MGKRQWLHMASCKINMPALLCFHLYCHGLIEYGVQWQAGPQRRVLCPNGTPWRRRWRVRNRKMLVDLMLFKGSKSWEETGRIAGWHGVQSWGRDLTAVQLHLLATHSGLSLFPATSPHTHPFPPPAAFTHYLSYHAYSAHLSLSVHVRTQLVTTAASQALCHQRPPVKSRRSTSCLVRESVRWSLVATVVCVYTFL